MYLIDLWWLNWKTYLKSFAHCLVHNQHSNVSHYDLIIIYLFTSGLTFKGYIGRFSFGFLEIHYKFRSLYYVISVGDFSIHISYKGSRFRHTDECHEVLMSLWSLVEKNKGIENIRKVSLYVWKVKFSATFFCNCWKISSQKIIMIF